MKRNLVAIILMLLTSACIAPSPTATKEPAVSTATSSTPTAQVTPTPGIESVWVFFTMAADDNMTPVPAARVVPQTDNQAERILSALVELVKGPTQAEKDAGLISWFSAETAGTAVMVTTDGSGFTANFTGWNTLIPNASTSAGSQMLLSQLNSTMFQFDFVGSVTYTLDGDCAVFWEWLQSGCHPVTRAEWEAG